MKSAGTEFTTVSVSVVFFISGSLRHQLSSRVVSPHVVSASSKNDLERTLKDEISSVTISSAS